MQGVTVVIECAICKNSLPVLWKTNRNKIPDDNTMMLLLIAQVQPCLRGCQL